MANFCFTSRVLGGVSSLWSSQTASPSVEPLPYEQAGVRVLRAPVFSASPWSRTSALWMRTGWRKGASNPSAALAWNRVSATWIWEGVRNAGDLFLQGRYHGRVSPIPLAISVPSEAAIILSWRRESLPWLKCHRLWLSLQKFSRINDCS